MKVLVKQAHIISPTSAFNGQTKDILIIDGIIQKIADNISENADEVIAHNQLHASIGWMDVFAHFADPGYEQKETLQSGAAAAAAGGFTDVMLLPNTNPYISSKAQVEYLIQKSLSLPVNIHPIGAITKNTEGKELVEMYDMHNSGAIAFSDGSMPVQSPGVLCKALQYVLAIDATVIQLPDDKSISMQGLMNEGIMSTRLGLPGKPAIAEELMIARDIELLRYTGSRLHLTGVSTRKGLELIEKAKTDGLRLSCSVSPYHCYFCDEDLQDYDSNLKLNPPLRTNEDRKAVIDAFNNGTADCIASHHMPQHWDDKSCEFEYAKDGMIGLETLFGVMNAVSTSLDLLIDQLSISPRKIFGLTVPEIKEGVPACLSLFNPNESYIFEASMIKSASRNTAFTGKELKGKVIGIINGNKIVINNR